MPTTFSLPGCVASVVMEPEAWLVPVCRTKGNPQVQQQQDARRTAAAMANLTAGTTSSSAAASMAKAPTPAVAAAGPGPSREAAVAAVASIPAIKDPQPRGPWDPEGFAFRKLDNKLAMNVFTLGGNDQRDLYRQLMDHEPAGGSLSLDHVHDVAKRMNSKHIGMLIACGGSGLVLGFWNVYSTSLVDVKRQLQELDARQRKLYDTVSISEWLCKVQITY